MKSFAEVLARAKETGGRTLAIAGASDPELASALERARAEGLCESEVYADARSAVRAVREGAADVLMKGSVDTKAFMKAVLDPDAGLRTGALISHVAVIEVRGRLFLITDGGICLNPTLDEKAQIIANAIPVARALGIETPRVAVLAAVEKVDPKMPETVDAEKLSGMAIPGCLVQGPLAVDVAIDEAAAAAKGVAGPVAGRADILLVPSVLVGNVFAKGIMYFASCRFGGVAAGTSRPVCFLSRSDDAETRLNTIALGVLVAGLSRG